MFVGDLLALTLKLGCIASETNRSALVESALDAFGPDDPADLIDRCMQLTNEPKCLVVARHRGVFVESAANSATTQPPLRPDAPKPT